MRVRQRLHVERLEDRAVPNSPGDIDWLRQFGSEPTASGQGLDPARAVAADGSIYVAGDLPYVLPGQTNAGDSDAGDSDAYVRKYDAAGNELWTRQFGTAGRDFAIAVTVDASGVYVVGEVADALPGQTRVGDFDAFVRKYDTNGNEVWTRQFGGASHFNGASAVAVDATGIYVAGEVSGALPGQTATGGIDAFVRKYDLGGNELWTRQFGTGFTFVDSIAVDASGVYVGGETKGALPGQVYGGRFIGDADAFVRKYDASGNELWTREFSGGDDDINQRVASVAADASGVYVVGTTRGTLPGQTNAGAGDAFVRKYDPTGNELWTHQFGTNLDDGAGGISVSASGVYVVGSTGGTLPGQTSAGSADAFVRKFDAAGNEIWTRQFGSAGADGALGASAGALGVYVVGSEGTSDNVFAEHSFIRKYDAAGTELWARQFGPPSFQLIDAARAVAADSTNVYIAGDVQAVLPGQTYAGGEADAFLRAYDAAGNELWTRQFGSASFDQALAVAADASGVYVAGYVDGALPGQTSAGGPDAFVRKYDFTGNELWTRQFGTPVADFADGLAVTAAGVNVSGSTAGALPGQSSAGDQDAFVLAFDASGNVLWARQFGSSGFDQATGLAADASGVYVGGFTAGVFAAQAAAGEQDAFLRKFDAAGNAVWTRQFGTASSEEVSGVAVNGSGVYVAGRTAGTLPGQTSAGLSDAFIRMFDTGGAELWTRQFGTAGADQVNGMAASPAGIYVAGTTDGALPGQAKAGLDDAFVRRYDTAGNLRWTGQFGTDQSDSAAGVAVGAAGLFVAGSTSGVFPGQTDTGSEDAFVARIVDSPDNTPPSNLVLDVDPTIDEGGTATLHGTFVDPDASDPHNVVIDWGPSEGTTTLNLDAGVTTFSAPHLYLDDGPTGTPSDVYAINVTVADASSNTAGSVNVTVNNLAPTAGISGPASGLAGDSLVFTLLATDPSPADQAAGFSFHIDWDGDGVADETVSGPSGMTVAHAFDAPGLVHVQVTAEDKDLSVSGKASLAVNVLSLPTVEGLVWVDFNNDGQVDFGERAIAGVTVTLTGTDDLGQSVHRVVQTDANGVYFFGGLRPSDAAGYSVAETQPAGFPDGRDTLGAVNGSAVGTVAANDVFAGIVLAQGGLSAENYNFGERPSTDGGVSAGQTATIGYWQNRNGQNLILALNGGPSATQLGDWLAATFPNMYAALDGQTNTQVATYYKTLFSRTSKTAPGGPPKVDAQVLATAFAVYVTNATLAGTAATAYGFHVSDTGVGGRTFNVGSDGAAFGAVDRSNLSVMDLLLAVNTHSHNGLLYDVNGDGQVSSSEAGLRTMANDLFTAINEAGDI